MAEGRLGTRLGGGVGWAVLETFPRRRNLLLGNESWVELIVELWLDDSCCSCWWFCSCSSIRSSSLDTLNTSANTNTNTTLATTNTGILTANIARMLHTKCRYILNTDCKNCRQNIKFVLLSRYFYNWDSVHRKLLHLFNTKAHF